MVNKYYYLVSSLPYLRYNQACPIAREAFLTECKKWLAKHDMDILSRVDINDFVLHDGDIALLSEWKTFDKNLREELAMARDNIKNNRHEKPSPLARRVIEQAHPMLMEQELEQIRWHFLDNLEPGNFFDLNFLVVYFLKIQILERLQMFDKEKGEHVFESMCEVEYV